jgi:glycerate-2-kinase
LSDARRARLERIFRRAVAAVHAGEAVARVLERDGASLSIAGRAVPDAARLLVLAAGKAACEMAAAVEAACGDRVASGIAVTKEGHGRALARIAVRESAHPVPDARSEAAARELLARAAAGAPDDVALVLLSGGASALLACPLDGLALGDVAATTSLLLASGADIRALNTVRKHLVDVAGGRLARAIAARRVEVLVVSDVLGDPPDVIASGPCAPDPTRYEDALAVLDRFDLRARAPAQIVAHLEAGARGEREESAKPGDPAFARIRTTIVAGLAHALDAAEQAARDEGLRPLRWTEPLAGEARDAARRMIGAARAAQGDRPLCLVAGGETTVTVRGRGRGGRSQELALAAAIELDGDPTIALLAAGTDGSDGPTDAAGAYADGGTMTRGAARGSDARTALADNDAYGFFTREGGVLRTGPTGTNVTDVLLVEIGRGPGR